jgi:hypothetical protein|tara:strand:+ start:126 stop:425 length:300 start_codon:yes stop_codon:yes gene_type:complete
MGKWRQQEDTRSYDHEAYEMVKELNTSQCYDLYDIVLKKLKQSNSETRDKELQAVKRAIESRRSLDVYKLDRIKNGFKGQMAQDARPKDGQTDVNRKKV